MVGDGRNDVMAAHGAGIKCIAAKYGYDTTVTDLGADAEIDSMGMLPDALAKLGFTF
jgi:phosphoglycolate phosphatase-like HAD superfamily hydrolase